MMTGGMCFSPNRGYHKCEDNFLSSRIGSFLIVDKGLRELHLAPTMSIVKLEDCLETAKQIFLSFLI